MVGNMSIALMGLFGERIVNAICDDVDQKPVIPWQRLYGYRFIHNTKKTSLTMVVILPVDMCFL